VSTLSIDFETRSTVELKKTGVYPYAAHPDTDIWCMAYAFDDGEVGMWVPEHGRWVPEEIEEHVSHGGDVRAWNAQFERVIWNAIMVPRYGFPLLEVEQVYDTAADAAAMNLPRDLDKAARVLGLSVLKDDEGHRLMMQMSRPRKRVPLTWWDKPAKLERLYEYCRQDVRVERAIASRLRPLSRSERAVYILDQKINDRGMKVDLPLVRAAQKIVNEGTRRANAEIQEITEGEVSGVTKVADLTKWLQAAGADITDLRKDSVRDFLNDGAGGAQALRVAELRQETGKSSTAKLKSMLQVACFDERARGLLLYHGAGTGRWAGKLLQPQNFPRPAVTTPEVYIPRVLAGAFDMIEIEEPALVVVSSMLRSMLVAAPGHRLMSGDYSQIEARTVAWIAGEDSLVRAFAAGAKIYEQMGAAYSGKPLGEITKDSQERQVGKNSVLGCGFQMGADRFAEQVWTQSGIRLPRGERDEKGALLPDEVDMAAHIVQTYRSLYPRIPAFWHEINSAAKSAVRRPGEIQACGRGGAVRFVVRGQFLWCVLPSGRPLAYALPRLEMRTVRPKDRDPFTVECVTFSAVDGITKQWTRFAGYGGMWTENVVQAMARDIMAAAMLRVEAAGYPVVLTVHDEVVCEVPDEHGSLEEFLDLMRVCPRWAEGLPVAAEGWTGQRYRK
jgi:DNA polymerase